jgi:uncharacterized damage-inducible protein DinB
MNVTDYIQRQLALAHRLSDNALAEITDEQFNWTPPGTLSSIGAILAHSLATEDFLIQEVIQNKPLIWESGGWGEKVGLPVMPGIGQGWEEARGKALKVAPLLAYQQAVRAAVDAYLAQLTAEELDRPVELRGNARPVADRLVLAVVHASQHAGEIAAIRGMQGLKGLPF